MLTSSGNLLFTVGITLLLRHCAGDDVMGDVIVSTRYGRVRGRRIQRDYGLGPGLYLHNVCTKVHTVNGLAYSDVLLFISKKNLVSTIPFHSYHCRCM